MNTVSQIQSIICAELRSKGIKTEIQIDEDFVFLDGHGLVDSLDIAVIVTTLSERLNKDPFAEGFINFRTIRDLANIYDQYGFSNS